MPSLQITNDDTEASENRPQGLTDAAVGVQASQEKWVTQPLLPGSLEGQLLSAES